MANQYTIQSGDTLTKIAGDYNTDVATLAKINNIQNPDRIFAGGVLNLPEAPLTPTLTPGPSGPATPTPLTIDTSTEPSSEVLTKYTSLDEIKKLLDESTSEINKTLTPTAEETRLKSQLADIIAKEDQVNLGNKIYKSNLEGQGISAGAIGIAGKESFDAPWPGNRIAHRGAKNRRKQICQRKRRH